MSDHAAGGQVEVVAWGVRANGVDGFVQVHKLREDAEWQAKLWGGGVVTPLYTAPPAAIPVAELRALAAQLASDAACKGLAPGYRSACGHIHNQLTALITAQEHRQ